MGSFKIDLQGIDWTLATHNNDINLGYEAFLRLFNTTLDKHAPIKEFTKKEEKDKLKPWVTKGIKKSMSVRDKIYKQMIKEKDQLIKTEKHKKILKYRNKITDLLKTSKQAHYHKYFEENKKNCRALWIGINEIVYSKNKNKTNSPSSLIQDSKTITDQKHIAEHFNNFFTSIGKKLQKNIPPTKKHFSSFLKNSNNLTFFITPTTVEEVNDLISDLKASKSIGPNSLPTKIMKQLNDIIASALAELINKSFQSVIFPRFSKLLRSFQSYK